MPRACPCILKRQMSVALIVVPFFVIVLKSLFTAVTFFMQMDRWDMTPPNDQCLQ